MFGGILPAVVLVLVLFCQTCHAKRSYSQQCKEHCGNIENIRYPFRLKGDSENCGHKSFELDCEHNQTVLYLSSVKHYVLAINYNDLTIRLVSVDIHKAEEEEVDKNCSSPRSLPLFSLTKEYLISVVTYPYDWWWDLSDVAVFMSCDNPVKSPLYVDIMAAGSNCNNNGVSNYHQGQYSYVAMGKLNLGDVADLCTMEMVIMITWPPDLPDGRNSGGGNLTLLDLHSALARGFELRWQQYHKESFLNLLYDFLINLQQAFEDIFWYHHYFQAWPLYAIVVVVVVLVLSIIFAERTLIGMPCMFAFLIYKFRRRHLSMFDNIEGFLQSQNNLMPIRYSYSDIKKMTNGFKDKLGEGGYGSVYRGKQRSGYLVAVKMLSKPKADGQEFINEVATIGRIHHVNVVQLVGYCAERSKRALVYDFMPNGSLEKYLFSQEGNFSLSCEQMYQISIGVARGIEYLHRGCDMQILHFDIKPHNILLDENFTPKVSDFGLAKLYPTDDSIVSLTAARGTLGYMAPELFYKNIGGVSYKADVYSFGMLLMELAGRRRNWNSSADSSQIFFPSWVYDQFTEGRHIEMGEATEEESEMVKKMMLVALWCIQMKPGDRPSMNKVVEMLEGSIECLLMPPKPFLYPQDMPVEDQATRFPNLSGACMDSITLSVSAR